MASLPPSPNLSIERRIKSRPAKTRRSELACQGAHKARRKFLRMFPDGFQDETYVAWERDYKWKAHLAWEEGLGGGKLRRLVAARRYREVADLAARIEGRTNLLFSFEKMAFRDAIKTSAGAKTFALGLEGLLRRAEPTKTTFEAWVKTIAALPRKQTRVLTWPLVTVFGFIARPDEHLFVKPNVMRAAAGAYGYPLAYQSRPSWEVYASALDFAETARRDLRDLCPRDMIDLQSFLWVQGSDEYAE